MCEINCHNICVIYRIISNKWDRNNYVLYALSIPRKACINGWYTRYDVMERIPHYFIGHQWTPRAVIRIFDVVDWTKYWTNIWFYSGNFPRIIAHVRLLQCWEWFIKGTFQENTDFSTSNHKCLEADRQVIKFRRNGVAIRINNSSWCHWFKLFQWDSSDQKWLQLYVTESMCASYCQVKLYLS